MNPVEVERGAGSTALARSECTVTRGPARPQARLRLVCFPHAGAGPAPFQRWAGPLGPEIELWEAALPGRVPRLREPFVDDWAVLIRDFADAVSAKVPAPYALLGQSLGTLIAFEVARELRDRGAPPTHLVAAAGAAPDRREALDLPTDDERLVRLVDRHYGGIPEAVLEVPELVAYFLPVLRADLTLAAHYRYRPAAPLDLPLTVFGGDGDRSLSAQGLSGWRTHTTRDTEIHRLPGGHFCLNDHEDQVRRTLRRRLLPPARLHGTGPTQERTKTR